MDISNENKQRDKSLTRAGQSELVRLLHCIDHVAAGII
jgi:hypothetical protein